MRPSPASAQTKEYCIGVLLLVICYLNAFVLHPAFFRRNKIAVYSVFSLISVLFALAVEFSWLYADIMGCLLNSFPPKEAHSYYWGVFLFVFLRDIGLLSFTFLLCEFFNHRDSEKKTEKLLLGSEDKILVKDYENNFILLNYKQIHYCEQEKNVTKIYVNGDKVFFRYGSLSSLQKLVGTNRFVQINRNTLVAKKQISQYSDGHLWLVDEENPFDVSISFQEQKELQPSNPKPEKSQEGAEKKSTKKNAPSENKKKNTVYQLIDENPGISAVGISEQTGFTQSTANRILKQLRSEGLITYEGSKKTGGYRKS